MRSTTVTRFRHHAALTIAGIIVALASLFAVADLGWPATPLMVIPLIFSAWAWRAGTDAGADGLRVRALLGSRDIAWSRVSALTPDGRGKVVASLTDGSAIPLTAVTAADLPRLVEASGQSLATEPE